MRKIDEARERILKLVLYVGAFFIAALIAQHITVPEAGPTPPTSVADFSKQRAILKNVEKALTDADPKLKEISKLAGDAEACPGQGKGVAIPHGGAMVDDSADVQGTLRVSKDNVHAVMQSLPGAVT